MVIAAQLRRRRGPVVRYWTADFELLHTEPVRVETWSHWLRRQLGRIRHSRVSGMTGTGD